jgi:hypothetical protein
MKRSVGFVITPGEIAARVQALDASIQALAGDVARSTASRVNAPWRREWNAFLRRWAIERDSYATWDARLFATRVMPRLEAFEANYRWWARDFEERSSAAPTVPKARPSEGLADALVPTEAWWIGAGAVALWLVLRRR